MNAKLIATSDYRGTPSPQYRFFLFDPEGDGLMFFRDAETRDAIAAEAIRVYCDFDGWSEEVVGVCAGEVTAFATKTDVETKPKRSEFASDDDYEDAMEEWQGGDYDETCNFKLLPLTAK